MGSDENFKYEFDVSGENERLARQHQAVKLGMGKLVLAPMDTSREGLKVLDAGTSDGRNTTHCLKSQF